MTSIKKNIKLEKHKDFYFFTYHFDCCTHIKIKMIKNCPHMTTKRTSPTSEKAYVPQLINMNPEYFRLRILSSHPLSMTSISNNLRLRTMMQTLLNELASW